MRVSDGGPLDHAQIAQLKAFIGEDGLLAVIEAFESDNPKQTSHIFEAPVALREELNRR
jgi:hypothetical protein